jgi:DNA-binding transcriptional ArsR family regulator
MRQLTVSYEALRSSLATESERLLSAHRRMTSIRGVSVLADPTRAAILRLMLAADGGRVLVGETGRLLGLRQPTVSHHMKALLDDGAVTREPAGRLVWYGIAADDTSHSPAVVVRYIDHPLCFDCNGSENP